MFNYDAIVVGAGPAGLTASLYLARGNRSVLTIATKIYDAQVGLLELIENYPGFPGGVSGAELIDSMVTQATDYGVELLEAEVIKVSRLNDGYSVECESGENFTCQVLIAANGSRHRKLNVPGEHELTGHGVFSCAFCDGGKFANQPVVVVGGGDAGITEAMYLTRLCSQVTVLEFMPKLNATPVLQDRAREIPNLTIRCGVRVDEILGTSTVEGLRVTNESGGSEDIPCNGVLVDIGQLPNTEIYADLLEFSRGRIIVDSKMSSVLHGLYAIGDIRSDSIGQIAGAVGDGAIAGINAIRQLQAEG
jgi:thioredoxin reductase (NADPH)